MATLHPKNGSKVVYVKGSAERLLSHSKYILKELSYEDMIRALNTAIHQFAKRQMTYFRGMERRGIRINWLDGSLSMEEKIEQAMALIHAT